MFNVGDIAILSNRNGTMGTWCIPERYWNMTGRIVEAGDIESPSFKFLLEEDWETDESYSFHVKADMLVHKNGPW